MHAIRLHEFGPAANLRYESVPDPEPAPGQVRIAVAAGGVHLVDTALRRGEPGPFPVPSLPTVPGREVAGTVDRVGEGVDPGLLGTRVVAHLGAAPGGYAEFATADADRLLTIPDGVSPSAAVAMLGTGRTTLGILLFTELDADSVAVVPAAAGGIGTLLVQYAVAATDVFDGVGGAIGAAAVELLGPGGRHLIFGWSSGAPTAVDPDARGITSRSVLGPPMLERAGGDLLLLSQRALTAAADGLFRPAITEFPLAEAARAHESLENRSTTGKVVLIP